MQATGGKTHGWDEAAVRAAVSPVLRAHAVELVELSFKTEQGGWVLRVTVEPPWDPASPPPPPDAVDPSVGLDELADISRDISAALDVADAIAPRYHLEVSSPGLDRPLRDARDFRRFMGRAAKVHLVKPADDGQRVLRGRIAAATDDTVTVEVDGKPLLASLADIARAHLVFELASNPKPGQRRGSRSPSAGPVVGSGAERGKNDPERKARPKHKAGRRASSSEASSESSSAPSASPSSSVARNR